MLEASLADTTQKASIVAVIAALLGTGGATGVVQLWTGARLARAEAALTLERRGNALAVPVQAISAQGATHSVFLIDSKHKIEQHPVELGIETPAKVEVLSGLHENDLAVVGSRSQFKLGQSVEPKIVDTGELKEER